jgi:hypothetical protein
MNRKEENLVELINVKDRGSNLGKRDKTNNDGLSFGSD